VRLVCRESGCAQRYLTHDAANSSHQTHHIDGGTSGEYHQRFLAYLDHVHYNDLTSGVAMIDGKGDRSLRPSD
jgi:4-hydroxybutyryl-CoA dehydratase/vinylacetyl-CoA-Delta-isomerase